MHSREVAGKYVVLEEGTSPATPPQTEYFFSGEAWSSAIRAFYATCTLTAFCFFCAIARIVLHKDIGLVDVYTPFDCISDHRIEEVNFGEHKGIAIDDTSLMGCASLLPQHWPNTDHPVRSLRLFFSGKWDKLPERRMPAFKSLTSYVHSNNVKVFMGTMISCNNDDDDRDWAHVVELMNMLGKDHIMGISIGNELDLLWKAEADDFPVGPCLDLAYYKSQGISTSKPSHVCGQHECIRNMWKRGGFLRKFRERIGHLDKLGFQDVPVTTVFGGMWQDGKDALYGWGGAHVEEFLRTVSAVYGKERWIFAFNLYGYFDVNACRHAPSDDGGECCKTFIERDTCLNCDSNGGGYLPTMTRAARSRILNITGETGWRLWIGETGWSAPYASTLESVNPYLADCREFSSKAAYASYYRNFHKWDLSVAGNLSVYYNNQISDIPAEGVDHVFWFTLRDSSNFAFQEHFGLMSTCSDTKCKLK